MKPFLNPLYAVIRRVSRTNKSNGMSWPHLEDTDSRSKLVFGPGVPVTYFLDKSGGVIHKHIGAYRSKSQLYEAVEKYFEVKL